MINIYPSKLDGQPIEVHQTGKPETIEAWLVRNVPSFGRRENPPVSISINGELIPADKWPAVSFTSSDIVDVYIEPRGLDPISWYIAAVYATSILVASMMPKFNQSSSFSPTGSKIDESNAKGNNVKLNSIIREVAGNYKIYPDYLLPPHRYFLNEYESWSEMLLCVGKGSFNILDSNVLIGDTRIDQLGDNASYTIYQPGADLSSVTNAKWYHTCTEVGNTSTGRAGLELNATYDLDEASTATAYQFDGFTVTIPSGAGEYPAWPNETIVRIEQFLDYEVFEGWSDRDIISGDMTSLDPFVGMIIEITGPNAGNYIINSLETDSDGISSITLNYDNGSQVNGLITGAQRMSIGYRNLQYKITSMVTNPISLLIDEMHVVRLTDMGDVDSWGGFGFAITNDAVIAVDASSLFGDWAGPFAACPVGETTDTIQYDIMFPNGLGYINSNGAITDVSVTVGLEWREVGSSDPWNTVETTYTNNTVNQIGYTETINLVTAIRPEVRMHRIGAKSASTSVADRVEWYALKSLLIAPESYAGVTTIAVTVRGGDKISALTDNQISVQGTRLLPTLSGGSWTAPTQTRDIIPWVVYVAKSIGYTDEDLDLDAMIELDTLWKSRGDYYDFSIESDSTVKSEISSALRAGFAEMTLNRGLIKPVRDQVRTVYEHMYTPQNMTEQLSRGFAAKKPDDFDGVDVEYIDSTSWAKETVECRLPGDTSLKVEKITLEGVTDRTSAWRIGMRQRRMHRYRRWNYQWGTELDALNSQYLSFCAVGDDVPGYSQSAILLSAVDSGTDILLRLSEKFTWTDGETHVIGIRRKDGTLSGPYTATRVSDYVISIPSIDFEPDTTWTVEPPHVIFGTLNRWSYPVLVTSISHNDNKCTVDGVGYDARVYADDDNTP